MNFESFEHGITCTFCQPGDLTGADITIRFYAEFWDLSPENQVAVLREARKFAAEITLSAEEETIYYPRDKWYHKPLSKTLRAAVIDRDKGICRYCGKPAASLTLDRVVPYAKGGESTPENLVVACKSCNSKKHARTPEEANMPLIEVPA